MTVSPESSPWPRSDKLQLIGVIVAVLAMLVGVIVAVAVPEIRCRIGLEECRPDGDDWTGVARTLGEPLSDPRLPYAAQLPPPVAPAGRYPSVSVPFDSITNRGVAVPVRLSGQDFYGYSSVDIVWSQPDGTVYRRYAAQVDERGLFEYALLWLPDPALDMAGNSGGWTVKVTDRTSGRDDLLQLNVISDGQTPPVGSWPDPKDFRPTPFVEAEVNAGTSGNLCADPGALATVRLAGFTPYARVRVDYRQPDSRVALAQGVRVDGEGRVTITTTWRSASCEPGTEYVYPVEATELESGRSARHSILLRTSQRSPGAR